MAEVIDYQTLYHVQDKLKRLGGKTLQNFLRNYALFSCKIHHWVFLCNERFAKHRLLLKKIKYV
ncbi:hypothetical protein, partial [Metabacillus sp. 22489]|uniref:hypothetical protein n=1 Tax=Metabacillus sp. 22489 TaxID=3453928 RepID=UPI003F82B71B